MAEALVLRFGGKLLSKAECLELLSLDPFENSKIGPNLILVQDTVTENEKMMLYEGALNIWESDDKTNVVQYYLHGYKNARTDLKVHKFKRSKEYQNLE